ncbi:hypothetical protein [Methanobrevibacter sp.]|uniref:hypothetical protein n=1 Tax=Methanobrevibacter sp. TaxID=66852 RepID=UPI0026E04975|nr:hypothetical protein [Methanobrevibacter sp.]MDO5860643.1 hypothetical protein [Methanobrevibacter sp.]
MSKKLMLVFIAVTALIISMSAISASDANDTSIGIQTSDDNIYELSDNDASDTIEDSSNSYSENTISYNSSDVLSSDSEDQSKGDAENASDSINTTFSVENTKVLKTDSMSATLSDVSGNALANQTVIFNIGSTNYTRTTNDKGVASLKMNMNAGNYTVNMFYLGDSTYSPANETFSIKVYEISTKVVAKDAKILRGNYYSVTLTDASGNALAGQSVIFKVNGKTYTRTTDSKGVAKLQMTMAANTYNVQTIFKSKDGYAAVSKTSTVKVYQRASTFKISKTTIIKGNYLVVYLKDSYGALAKKTVTLTINGKKYTRTTNSAGAAKLKIGLAAKTYVLRLAFAGDTAHKSTSKTAKIVVKTNVVSGQLVATGTKTIKGKIYTYSASNKNTVLVKNGGKLTFTNGKIIKTGDVSSAYSENSDFYGTNAAVLVTSKSTLYLSDTSITTNAKGANAVFVSNLNSQSSGATAYLTNVVINTYKDKSRGLDATYGGKIIAKNVTINTRGGSCAALATDRGEGTVTATNCVLNTGVGQKSGSGSPCIYSTGTITATKCTGTSYVSQIACIEGKNSITLNSCNLVGYGKGNRYVSGSYVDSCGVFLYQSMSGDAASGVSKFTATNSKLSVSSASSYYKSAPMFFVTNTQAKITLKNTSLKFGSGILLKAAGQSQWGTSGSNGGKVIFNAINQKLTGKIIVDKISTLTLSLTKSKYSGCINPSSSYGTTKVTVKSGSTWTLTGNSHVTSLTNYGTIVYGSHTLYVNGVAYTASNPYKG